MYVSAALSAEYIDQLGMVADPTRGQLIKESTVVLLTGNVAPSKIISCIRQQGVHSLASAPKGGTPRRRMDNH